MRSLRKSSTIALFESAFHHSSFPASSRCAVMRGLGQETVLGLRLEDPRCLHMLTHAVLDGAKIWPSPPPGCGFNSARSGRPWTS